MTKSQKILNSHDFDVFLVLFNHLLETVEIDGGWNIIVILILFVVGMIFINIKVHEDWWSWGCESKIHTIVEGEMDSDEVTEVNVVEMWLSLGKNSADSAEGGGDISSESGELNLVLWVVELDSVLIDELTEEVTSDLEVLGEAIWSDLLWPKFSTNLFELFGKEIEDLFPSDLVGCVLNDTSNKSIFTSKISSEVRDDVLDRLMLVVLLEKSLKTNTELEEVSSDNTGLVRQSLVGVWLFASFLWLSAEGVVSGDFDSEVLDFNFVLEVGQHSFF